MLTWANDCIYGCGTCKKYIDGDCGKDIKPGSRCIQGDGRCVTKEEAEANEVTVHCGDCTCKMYATEYIRWNGLCIHQY